MMAASDRKDKLAAAALAMGIALAFSHLPHRTGILLAVAISVTMMLVARRRSS